jgi:hypothetical protein
MEWAVDIAMGAVREQARRLYLVERVSEWKSQCRGQMDSGACLSTNIESTAWALI